MLAIDDPMDAGLEERNYSLCSTIDPIMKENPS